MKGVVLQKWLMFTPFQESPNCTVERGCLHRPQSATANVVRSRQWLTTVAQQGNFPYQRKSFFLLSSTAAAHRVSNILAVWLSYIEKAIPNIKRVTTSWTFCQQLTQWKAHLKTAGQRSRTKTVEPVLSCHLAHPCTSLHSVLDFGREGRSILFAN